MARGVVEDLRRALGEKAVRTDVAALVVHSRDASHFEVGNPLCVCWPADTDQARLAVEICAQHRTVWVARGGGTGLSGGALPPDGAVVLAMGRLRRLGRVDPVTRTVHAEAGVFNADIAADARPAGLTFAPDPSSQAAATIGGNIAENAGGPHCLRDGVTAGHVRRLDWVDHRGRCWSTGRGHSLERGIGLRGLLIGSEGTLGLVTGADLRLTPVPEAEVTLLAAFPELQDATAAVVRLLTAGLLPAAVEMVDRAMLQAVEAAFRFGFPTDVDAVLIGELAGSAEAVAEDAVRAEALLRESGAGDVRLARDPADRQDLWRCRKRAFGAVGRLAPAYISADIVVPLGRLPRMVQDIQAIRNEHAVEIATAFHAGDGNLHPGVHYDDREPGSRERAQAASDAIALRALELGGSLTGEHGVGVEKRHLVHRQLDARALELMHGIKRLCDPQDRINPDKALPPAGVPGRAPVRVPDEIDFQWDSLTVTAPASTPLDELQAAALDRGLWIPVGACRRPRAGGIGLGTAGTVAEVIDHGLAGPSLLGDQTVADVLVELWAEEGTGRVLHVGAAVAKNVAGYDLLHLLAGSGGCLARPRAATFLMRPAPEMCALWSWRREGWRADVGAREALLRRLHADTRPAAALVDFTGPEVLVAVLAAGRDRAWDLDGLGDHLTAWSEEFGLGRPQMAREKFSAVTQPRFLSDLGLPTWLQGAPDWTLLTSGQAGVDQPRFARGLWQTRPEALWLPEICGTVPPGWFADHFAVAGRISLPPPPPVTVPRPLLRDLKQLFDPDGRLPAPAWLVSDAAAARR